MSPSVSQFLTHPFTPTTPTRQADPAPAVRGQAYRQLLLEHEKHPEFLPARLLDGVSLAYRFQKQAILNPGQSASALLTVAGAADDRGRTAEAEQCILGPLYASSIRGNRKHRYAFLRGLLSLFEAKPAPTTTLVAGGHHRTPGGPRRGSLGGASSSGGGNGSGTAAGWRDPAFLAFVARVAAALPFDVQEEPLFLVYHISRLVSLDGSALLSELRTLFARAGMRAAQEGEEDEGGGGGGAMENSDSEDSLAPQEPEQGPGEEEGMEVDGDGKGGQQGQGQQLTPALLAEIKAKCAQGMSFGALLHLKFYLKQVCARLNRRPVLVDSPICRDTCC